jgi:hypothetical protein
MKFNFENEVRKMHKKEVQSFHKELAENNELYYEQIASEGYDNLHDYEAHITSGLIKRILIAGTILFVFIVGYLLL